MKEKWIYISVPALVLLGAFIYLLCAGVREAETVKAGVLRFHVVAASDGAEDQQLKIAVRDGLFAEIQALFAPCENREAAIAVAQKNAPLLQAKAEQILKERGCTEPVTIEIGERFFPTKDYGKFSFPAGKYQALSVRIGEAEGQNFWCVLYPALCLAPAVESDAAEGEMTALLGKNGAEFLKREALTPKIKFALAEWWGNLFQK